MDEKRMNEMIEFATELADIDYQYQHTLVVACKEAGLSVEDIALGVGESVDGVRNVESGDPTLSDIRLYALAVKFPEALSS